MNIIFVIHIINNSEWLQQLKLIPMPELELESWVITGYSVVMRAHITQIQENNPKSGAFWVGEV